MGSRLSHCEAAADSEILAVSGPGDAEFESAPAPVSPPAKMSSKSLKDLSATELESLKAEVVEEIVVKIAGEDGEKLQDFLTPELITAPYDPRFPNRNQARHCFVRFNEYYKCSSERSPEDKRCQFYQRAYQAMCPSEWLEEWMELREKGLWVGKY